MKEIWKDIKGYEGQYQISNLGRVKSLARIQKIGLRNIKIKPLKEIILKQSKSTSGYYQVCLCKNSVKKTHAIHKLVAKHFILNENNKKQVNHIDGNKTNNFYKNLEWCSYHENLRHAIKNGLRAVNEKNGRAKLKNIEVLQIRQLYKTGKYTHAQLGEMYGIASSTTQQVISRRYWKTI